MTKDTPLVIRKIFEPLAAAAVRCEFCAVVGRRGSGRRTTLDWLARRLAAVEELSVLRIDLSKISDRTGNEGAWLRGLLHAVAAKADLEPDQNEHLHELLERLLARDPSKRFVLVLDQFSSGLAAATLRRRLEMLRRSRGQDEEQDVGWERIGIVLAIGVEERAGFDGWRRFDLPSAFLRSELDHLVAPEGEGGIDETDARTLDRLVAWTGGAPALTMRIFGLLEERSPQAVDAAVRKDVERSELLRTLKKHTRIEDRRALRLMLFGEGPLAPEKNPLFEVLEPHDALTSDGRTRSRYYELLLARAWHALEFEDEFPVKPKNEREPELSDGDLENAAVWLTRRERPDGAYEALGATLRRTRARASRQRMLGFAGVGAILLTVVTGGVSASAAKERDSDGERAIKELEQEQEERRKAAEREEEAARKTEAERQKTVLQLERTIATDGGMADQQLRIDLEAAKARFEAARKQADAAGKAKDEAERAAAAAEKARKDAEKSGEIQKQARAQMKEALTRCLAELDGTRAAIGSIRSEATESRVARDKCDAERRACDAQLQKCTAPAQHQGPAAPAPR